VPSATASVRGEAPDGRYSDTDVMAECIFCNISTGDADASVVYRDSDCIAFMDVAPINEGHILVVPRQHAERLADLDEGAAAHVMAITHRVSAAVRASGVPCDAIFLFLADGEVAGQEVPHVHMHIVPRFVGDTFRIPECGRPVARAELDTTSAQIAAALA